MSRTAWDRTKIMVLALAVLAVVSASGCKSSSDNAPATAADKKAFAGVDDPAQKAKDMAAVAATMKAHAASGPPAGAPPAGTGH